jgi:hypothetical protein
LIDGFIFSGSKWNKFLYFFVMLFLLNFVIIIFNLKPIYFIVNLSSMILIASWISATLMVGRRSVLNAFSFVIFFVPFAITYGAGLLGSILFYLIRRFR